MANRLNIATWTSVLLLVPILLFTCVAETDVSASFGLSKMLILPARSSVLYLFAGNMFSLVID